SIEASSCDNGNDPFYGAVCAKVFVGSGMDGDACTLDVECASAFCSLTQGSATCPTGTCEEPPTDGESCSIDDECGPGTACDYATMRCSKPVQQGGECNSGYGQCAGDLDCV